MDANGTRFHLLLGKTDWRRCRGEINGTPVPRPGEFGEATGLNWDEFRSELTLFPQLFQFPAGPVDQPLQLEQRRGAACDRFGNWYWVAPDETSVLVRPAESQMTAEFWRPGLCGTGEKPSSPFQPGTAPPPVALSLAGLAVTADHYLVVGVREPQGAAGYLVFDLAGGGAPMRFVWPSSVAFVPFDMAPRPGGGVWILDCENQRYWGLDRHFHVAKQLSGPLQTEEAPALFRSVSGESPPMECVCHPVASIADADAWRLSDGDGVAIEGLREDLALILHSPIMCSPPGTGPAFSEVSLYRLGKRLGEKVSLTAIIQHIPSGQRDAFRLVGHDFAFVPRINDDTGIQLGRLFVAADGGNQSFAFDVYLESGQLRLESAAAYLPMRAFGGKGLVAAGTQAHYDFADAWIPLIEQPRPSYPLEATLQTPVFDSHEPQCVWHRLLLDAGLPAETAVEVWSRAADVQEESDDPLPGITWEREPRLYRRGDGSELPFLPRPLNPDRGTFELLFQKARGRYLQLKLRLVGHGRVTPRLRALRAYYPRFSYLKEYLPAIYREDQESASFLDRFLANVEGFYSAIEDKIAAAQVLFDVRSAPAEVLDWLAGWFGVALDPAWDERKQRLFIRHAMEFFQFRGTIHGVQMALRLALEEKPGENFLSNDLADRRCAGRFRIVEKFRTRRTPAVALGDPTEIAGPRAAVSGARWKPEDGVDDLQRRFREYLGAALTALRQGLKDLPAPEPASTAWTAFLIDSLRFVPDPAQVETRWRIFLERKHLGIAALNGRYATAYGAFGGVPVPRQWPVPQKEIEDWLEFVLASSKLPFSEPADNNTAALWRDFTQSVLGFAPAAASDDLERWRDFLAERYGGVDLLNLDHGSDWADYDEVPLPKDVPEEGALREDWNDFVLESTRLDAGSRQTLWQAFLARRYRRIADLRAEYGASCETFAQVRLPDDFPANGAPLKDWFQFETVALAMHRTAHKFVALLPVSARDMNQTAERPRTLALARRLIELEKPAHTVFDVKFYWAMFRVGEARLGEDTLLGLGSRAPELLMPMILNQGYLLESYLAPNPPRDTPGRFLLGTHGA